MTEGFKKSASPLALAVAAGFLFAGTAAMPANAADLGGDCCADLEERIAELEVTTVRKGNRKVSVMLYGQVTRALMVWESNDEVNGGRSDAYVVGIPMASSRFGIKGKARIGRGWSAGFKMEWQTADTLSSNVNQFDDDNVDAEGLTLRQEYLYLKHVRFGSVAIGNMSTATDGIAQIDLSGTKLIARTDAQNWNGGFAAGIGTWGNYINDLDGVRRDVIRYDTPVYGGVTASFAWGEDDYWDVALRYSGEFGGVIKVAAGAGYQFDGDNNGPVPVSDKETWSGSLSAMHIPTGLFVTVSGGERSYQLGGIANASTWYIKGGMKQKFTHLGSTSLYGEYAEYDDFNPNDPGALATMWGLGVVQNIDAAAMQVFVAYRQYDLDIPGVVLANDFNAVMIGGRIKF